MNRPLTQQQLDAAMVEFSILRIRGLLVALEMAVTAGHRVHPAMYQRTFRDFDEAVRAYCATFPPVVLVKPCNRT